MEEVWKDIVNVSSLPGEDPHIADNNNFHDVNLPDFLAQPFAKNEHGLNLNAYPDLNFEQPSGLSTISNDMLFEGFGSNSTTKKRVTDHVESIGDRRYKRMMKNRESAARSRARKQAYRYQLEEEIEILKAENAKLREQLKAEEERLKLRSLEEASPLPTTRTLRRASTAATKQTLRRASSAPASLFFNLKF